MNRTHIIIFLLLTFWINVLFGQENQIEKSIFIISNTNENGGLEILEQIQSSSTNTKNNTLLIVGNTLESNSIQKSSSKTSLGMQLDIISDFNGQIIFTPGYNEWKASGYKNVKRIEDFIQENSKAKYYPDDGCPIKKKDMSENTVLITIDSQWFLENWDKNIYINDDCDIQNRTQFFQEYESILKKNQDKIKIVAMHHPIFSNSKAGLIARTGGTSIQDFQNKQYTILRNNLITLTRQQENTIFVSGSDKNLQYINKYGIPQVMSGSVGKTKNTRNHDIDDFSSSKNGYAKLDIYSNGKVIVNYYEIESNSSIFSTTIFSGEVSKTSYNIKPKSNFGVSQKSSVYSIEETTKGKLYRGLWGDHYRKYYSTQVEAPVVFLDTLMGGLTPIRRGGGHQSKSLRLEDKNGKQYVMRALRKSAIKFLQATAFQDKYIEEDLQDSFADRFLLDFYTTAHPYTPFAISQLADAVDVYHTNPTLYYIPKQEALGVFNDEYGDELYMIEERVASNHKDLESFGKPKDILSTDDVLQEIRKTGKSIVDEPSYIRARLFDMLIGDWDRHEDQWRWARFEKVDGTEVCKPIPRDRDQAFSVFDGSILSFLRCAVPFIRMMQSFDSTLPNTKWFNFEPYPLDLTFINKSDWTVWEKQLKYIQTNLTDEVIEQAFEELPDEIKGETIDEIKAKLRGRRQNLKSIAREYYLYINKFEVVVGTQKDDDFVIKRLPNGKTSLDIHRKDLGIFNRTFTNQETKEIWLYGLDGNDSFKVEGDGDHPIMIRAMGGRKNDTYDFKNPKKIKLYDYKSKKNTIINKKSRKWLVDSYEINNYDYKKRKYHVYQLLPLIAFNPDDGLRVGVLNNFTQFGLQRNPFTSKHSFGASCYTGSSGFDVSYSGEFSNIFHNWNLGIDAKYNSPTFAINFFGFGNDTEYDRDDVDLDFNRTRIEKLSGAISLIWRGRDGGNFYFKPLFESFEVENTSGRFINTIPDNNDVFEKQNYIGAEIHYHFENKNDLAFPTFALNTGITTGYKTSIDKSNNENNFAYIEPYFSIDHSLTKNGNIVFATKIGGEAILGDNFEFYHGAQLGGNNGLRGFRNERFTGKYSVYQNIDLRYQIGKFKTSFIPLKYGLTAGFDHGRIWIVDDQSDTWHTTIGGSFWMSGLDTFSANAGFYGSEDGGRIVFTVGFAF
ncbi:metallophosphatase [Aquimarina sp. MMG016]|uniref:metallophosphatase n=1 Tax=Aquimarina sp. MMG016 TaxID=2822690 RepID=UPI001B3A69EC|nr:metallophosphatase [Aquimarina sp. MMG016]MBQ4821551.1 metallophosphatase [Aquimarina sp. MMG016]